MGSQEILSGPFSVMCSRPHGMGQMYGFGSEAQKPLDHGGELHGKLIQIRDIQKRIAVNALDVLLYR